MLSFFILSYLFLAVVVGVVASKLVHTSKDYVLAGRRLSLFLCGSSMFSTWFGSETIMGASAEFVQHGFLGVIEDPFGTSLGFIVIGLFFAKPLYKLNLLTIVDFYKLKFGRRVEQISAFFMIFSYIGWVSAQLLAMAIILKVVLACSLPLGIVISAIIVCSYTALGGMWSISINDFIQTLVIFIGLLVLTIFVFQKVDDVKVVVESTPSHFFNLLPERSASGWVHYLTAWITVGLGSIPQQDVFQRVMSAKSQKVAVQASYLSGVLYLTIAFLPLVLAVLFKHAYPELGQVDPEQILPQAVMNYGNFTMKVFFFGALLSAIMSSASGAVLAPATILGENMLKPLLPGLDDRKFLIILRLCVLLVVVVATVYAMLSESVYALVAESSAISLVSLLVPLVAGIYWRGATALGASLSILLGIGAWGACRLLGHGELACLLGLGFSTLGMVAGSVRVPAFVVAGSKACALSVPEKSDF